MSIPKKTEQPKTKRLKVNNSKVSVNQNGQLEYHDVNMPEQFYTREELAAYESGVLIGTNNGKQQELARQMITAVDYQTRETIKERHTTIVYVVTLVVFIGLLAYAIFYGNKYE